ALPICQRSVRRAEAALLARQHDRAGIRGLGPGNHFHQCRFPGAVVTANGVHLTGVYAQVDAAYGFYRLVGLAQIAGCKNRLHGVVLRSGYAAAAGAYCSMNSSTLLASTSVAGMYK